MRIIILFTLINIYLMHRQSKLSFSNMKNGPNLSMYSLELQ